MPDLWAGHLWLTVANWCILSSAKCWPGYCFSQPWQQRKKIRQSLAFMHIQRRSPCSLSVSCTCALEEAQPGGTASRESEWYYWEGYFYSVPESAESAVNNKHHRRVMTAEDLSPTVRCCKVWMPVRPLLFWLCSRKKIPFVSCVCGWLKLLFTLAPFSFSLPWGKARVELGLCLVWEQPWRKSVPFPIKDCSPTGDWFGYCLS